MIAQLSDPSGEGTSSGSELSRSVVRAVNSCRVLAELGQGGMANVYLAVTQSQAGVNKLVVLKALRTEQAAEPESLAMFLDEARIAAQLNHPNVVQTYEVGSHDDRYVMVMEYLEGQPLSRVLRDSRDRSEPLPLAMGLRIMSAALDGLHYAHELRSYTGKPLGLVHRDISPQNIFVTYEGQVKVLDFGIAKAASSSTHTAAGIIKGKFAYMAPEHMTGGAVDRRADLYSVGCILWAMAAGEKLWSGVPEVQFMRRVLKNEIPSPRSVNPNCDSELEGIIAKCLAHDRDQRYATAFELQADLDEYCERRGFSVKPKKIGKLVAELFAEHRSQVRELVEAQLSRVSVEPIGVPPLHIADGSRSSGAVGPSPKTKAQSRRGRFALVVAGAALAAAALLIPRDLIFSSSPSAAAFSKRPSAPTELTAAAEPKTAEADPAQVATLRLEVTPADAAVFLDGAPLAEPSAPLRLLMGSGHTLRAEAEGHGGESLAFTVTGDATLSLTLEKSAPARGSAARKRGTIARGSPRIATAAPKAEAVAPAAGKAPKPATVTAAKSGQQDCDNPFFIDASGIKRVRPECR